MIDQFLTEELKLNPQSKAYKKYRRVLSRFTSYQKRKDKKTGFENVDDLELMEFLMGIEEGARERD